MRLGTRRYFYIRSRKRINKKKVSAVLIIWLLIALLGYSTLFFLKTVRPILATVAEAKANYLATLTIHHAIQEVFQDQQVTYQDLISFQRNAEGDILAVQPDMIGVNQIRAMVSMEILEQITNLSETGIEIPLGSLMGSDLFAGLGPRIKVKLMPVAYTYVNFLSDFQEAGINQTKLEINLEVETNMMLLMPTVRKNSKVVTKVPVIQTLIVGKVPESYMNVDRDGNKFEEDILDIFPHRK